MVLKHWTPKMVALVLIGAGVSVLFIMSITLVSRHQFRSAAWLATIGVLLTVIFFRHRKIAFAMTVLSWLLVNAGITAPFHPTAPGIITALVSAFLLGCLCMWMRRRYPHLKRIGLKQLFDGDPT